MAIHKCIGCGKEFKRPGTKGRYCSRSCAARDRGKMPPVACRQCGISFQPTQSGIIYCSNECRGLSRRTRQTLTCEQCGTLFERTPSRVARGERYCSRACALTAKAAKMVSKVCPQCSRTFSVSTVIADRYTVCSKECRLATTKYTPCKRCGRIFVAEKRLNRHYCSEECRRPPMLITCRTCQREFRCEPGDTDRQFCSFACYRRSQAETSLEKRVRQTIDALGIEYIQEARMGRYSIDFLIPSLRIALEADGVYWHQDPRRDARKQRYLQDRGWRICRLTEREVVNTDNLDGLLIDRLQTVAALNITPLQPALF